MTDIKTIICAGGEGNENSSPRWNNYLGVTRHMIPAAGEPLIHRLQRQLHENNFDNVHVACLLENRTKYVRYNNLYIPSPKRSGNLGDYSVIWSYRRVLNYTGTTIILFADTFYTDEIIKAIKQNPMTGFNVYGRFAESNITQNKRRGEVFCYVIHASMIPKYLQSAKCAMEVLSKYIADRVGIPEDVAKYSYKKFCGIDYREIRVENQHWIEWDDLTDDFDYPEDWDTKSKLFPNIFYI